MYMRVSTFHVLVGTQIETQMNKGVSYFHSLSIRSAIIVGTQMYKRVSYFHILVDNKCNLDSIFHVLVESQLQSSYYLISGSRCTTLFLVNHSWNSDVHESIYLPYPCRQEVQSRFYLPSSCQSEVQSRFYLPCTCWNSD